MTDTDWMHVEKLATLFVFLMVFWIMSNTLRSWTNRADSKWLPIVAISLYGLILLTGMFTMTGTGLI